MQKTLFASLKKARNINFLYIVCDTCDTMIVPILMYDLGSLEFENKYPIERVHI